MKQVYLPTRIITGNGCLAHISEHASTYGQKALIVCGTHSLRASGRLDRVLKVLKDTGLQVTVYDAISGEPTLHMVQTGLDMARQTGAEVIVGMGGGSAIDAAKAIAGLYTHEGTVEETFCGSRTVTGGGLPWIAVPTTAGTGAEVTKNAVLISPQHSRKASLRHDEWFADVAIVDPELTLDAPPEITAASGSDALTQAIEAYTSIGASPVTDALAARAIQLIGRSLQPAYRNGQDLNARADMLYGSMLAGMAFANARLGGVHGMAHPLGCRYHIPHGTVCGLLLPYVMDYNVEYAATKYAHIAQVLGISTEGMDTLTAAAQAAERARELVTSVGIPMRLGPLGVKHEDLDLIAEESLPSGSLKHNPRPLLKEDVLAILQEAL